MNRSEFLSFCGVNAIGIIFFYTIFLILFINYVIKKVNKMRKIFNETINFAQSSHNEFAKDVGAIDSQSRIIKKTQEKIIFDVNYILKLLDKYKGVTFDTKINNQISSEIADIINSNVSDTNNGCTETKSIIEESNNDKIDISDCVRLSDICYEDSILSEGDINQYTNQKKSIKNDSYSSNIKIGQEVRFSSIVEKTIDFSEKVKTKFKKQRSKDKSNSSNDFMKELEPESESKKYIEKEFIYV